MIYEIDTERIARDMQQLKDAGYTFRDALMIEILGHPALREGLVAMRELRRPVYEEEILEIRNNFFLSYKDAAAALKRLGLSDEEIEKRLSNRSVKHETKKG